MFMPLGQPFHKRGLFIIYYYLFIIIYSVNIKPSRHRFGFSLAWGWQYIILPVTKLFFKLGGKEEEKYTPPLVGMLSRIILQINVDPV